MEINKAYKNITLVQGALISVRHKECLVLGFTSNGTVEDKIHLALIFHPNLSDLQDVTEPFAYFAKQKNVLTRIHSECILGDALHSTTCDCAKQLDYSLETICKEGKGIVIYLRQEGRGIGLRAKLSALSLQEGFIQGKRKTRQHTPDEANIAIGYPIDARDYAVACEILKLFNVESLTLITGNPEKIVALEKAGIRASSVDIPRIQKQSEREILELREKIGRKYNYQGI